MENTLVALFGEPQEADAVRNELINAGFDGNDVSIFTEQRKPDPVDELVNTILGWIGKRPAPMQASFVSVFATRDHLETAEAIIRRHHPSDVKEA